MTLCSILAVVALVASGCFMFEPSTYENRSTEDGNVWYVLAMWRRAPSKTQALKEVAMASPWRQFTETRRIERCQGCKIA